MLGRDQPLQTRNVLRDGSQAGDRRSLIFNPVRLARVTLDIRDVLGDLIVRRLGIAFVVSDRSGMRLLHLLGERFDLTDQLIGGHGAASDLLKLNDCRIRFDLSESGLGRCLGFRRNIAAGGGLFEGVSCL